MRISGSIGAWTTQLSHFSTLCVCALERIHFVDPGKRDIVIFWKKGQTSDFQIFIDFDRKNAELFMAFIAIRKHISFLHKNATDEEQKFAELYNFIS